jgi:hypothetical protein
MVPTGNEYEVVVMDSMALIMRAIIIVKPLVGEAILRSESK